jgi:FkbM family methyltransferase
MSTDKDAPEKYPTELLRKAQRGFDPMGTLRSVLRHWLHRAVLQTGFRLQRIPRFEQRIRLAMEEGKPFTMIQVGAHNGVTSDPFHRLLIELQNWQALLLEPQREPFEVLQSIYAGLPRVTCRQVAVGDHGSTLKLYRVGGDTSQLPYWATQLASTRREVIEAHRDQIPNLSERIVCDQLPCVDLPSLFRNTKWPRLDLLVTDVEGADFEVIQQIDQLPSLPRFLFFEDRHLTSGEKIECLRFLQARRYRVVWEQSGDCFAEHFDAMART